MKTIPTGPFALRVYGNSMEPAVRPGSVVVCEPTGDATPGDIVIAQLASHPAPTYDPVIKAFGEIDGQSALISLNPANPPICAPFQILARVIKVYAPQGAF